MKTAEHDTSATFRDKEHGLRLAFGDDDRRRAMAERLSRMILADLRRGGLPVSAFERAIVHDYVMDILGVGEPRIS